jgi:hypothetical protein
MVERLEVIITREIQAELAEIEQTACAVKLAQFSALPCNCCITGPSAVAAARCCSICSMDTGRC